MAVKARTSKDIQGVEFMSMLRVAGEAGLLPPESEARRKCLLEGLCKLVGAHSALLFVMSDDPINGPLSAGGPIVTTRMTPEQDAKFRQVLQNNPEPRNPIVPALVRRPGPLLTQHRTQVSDDERVWYGSGFFEQEQRPLGLDDVLYARLPLPNGKPLAIALFRPLKDALFTDRDCRLVDCLHEQAGRLYGTFENAPTTRPSTSDPNPQGAPPKMNGATQPSADGRAVILSGLPPRLRPVLRHLLEGDAEKQVAMKLGLSPHTVHQYTKLLYRTLDVNSRSELLARYVGRVETQLVAG